MRKTLSFLIIAIIMAVFASHGALAANITADDTPCNSFSELYVEGNNLPITEYCMIRSCFSENRSAQFYFKYSKNHKEKLSVMMTDYTTGSFLWSNGVELSLSFNESKKIDVDSNGYYDQKVWYEIDKPEINQICLKIYELKEGSQYKVPSASTLALLSKNSSTASTNTTKSSNITSNITIIDLSANISNATNTSLLSNASAPAAAPIAPATPPAQQEAPAAEQKNESLEIINSKTEIIEQGQAGNNDATGTASATPLDGDRIVIGVSIVVFIILLIVAGFLIYERKKKHDFSVRINEEIGKVDLGKKD